MTKEHCGLSRPITGDHSFEEIMVESAHDMLTPLFQDRTPVWSFFLPLRPHTTAPPLREKLGTLLRVCKRILTRKGTLHSCTEILLTPPQGLALKGFGRSGLFCGVSPSQPSSPPTLLQSPGWGANTLKTVPVAMHQDAKTLRPSTGAVLSAARAAM